MKAKPLTTLLLYTLTVLLIASCSKTKTNSLKVKFTNRTGYKLKSLKIGEHRIENLELNQTSDFIFYQSMTLDGSMPVLLAEAKINGQKTNQTVSDCATMWKTIYEGTYYLDILLIQDNNTSKLRLDKQ